MLKVVTEIVISFLAAWALTETARHGTILERPRAWLEARGGLIAEWISCGFCFSHWAAFLSSGASLYVFEEFWDSKTIIKLLLVWLCSIRLSNLGNDLTHCWCRTPRMEEIKFDAEDPKQVVAEESAHLPDPKTVQTSG